MIIGVRKHNRKTNPNNTSLFPTHHSSCYMLTPTKRVDPAALSLSLFPSSSMFSEGLKSMRRLGWRHVLSPFFFVVKNDDELTTHD